jgi:cell division transport system permease protein
MSDRMLPLLVAAMAFLAALALAGWFGTAALSRHWQQGAAASLTVQVPQPGDPSARPDQTRLAAVLALLTGTPGVASAHALSDQELTDLLKPWLGQGPERLAIPMPAVIAVRLNDSTADLDPLSRRLNDVAPGTLLEDHGVWIRRLAVLARSLQACAGLALLLVAGVAAAVIAVATRAGLSTRREAIEIVHGLGATDRYIAGRFAGRATLLAATGAAGGAIAALPILLALARMAAPFAGEAGGVGDTLGDALGTLPGPLWAALPCLPLGAAAIGYATAHGAVRRWLRRLP